MRNITTDDGCLEIDNGIFFGAGVFETILINNGVKFLDFHIKRLKNALKVLNIKELSLKEEENIYKYIKSLSCNNKALKITVTEKNIIITIRNNTYTEEIYKEGLSLKISSVFRNSTSIMPKIKSINYIENILEKRNAIKEGFNDALFFNEKGFLCETAVANIFCIKDNKIYTPKIENGLLNGTVRKWIIENFKVYEENINLESLKNMDEVFLTNSLVGIIRVNRIDNFNFDKDKFIDIISDKYKSEILDKDGGYGIL